MNIKVIGVISIVVLFALASGIWSYSVSENVSGDVYLKNVYSEGNIQVIQKTSAGSVPHEVTVINNGNKDIEVKEGDMLTSTVSEGLVIAENKKIASNSSETIKAYGIEPSKRVNAGTKLLPVNNTCSAINQVINNSNPSDPQSAMKAQLQIWVITTGGDLNPYTGEPVAIVKTNNILWKQFRQDIESAKNDVMTMFNVSSDGIKNLNQTTVNAEKSPGADNAISWIKETLGI